ncbi:TetR/AcrR family transcriptional regulator [Virgibacillus flavescens]|uniref:TetR/AcrR family transcriptional regulator n=1 Tax=Virgibacillus flavescens TaxID=1611422 RepID=UPI003D35115F
MPKGFSEHEKQRIITALVDQGKLLFSKYGLQKTSITELTKQVGIAQGTFYKFYNSKEALYFEILEQEEEKIKKQFAGIDIQAKNQPKQAIKQLLLQTINTIETNPFIRQLYVENTIESLLRKLPPERLEEHFNNDSAALLPLIRKWQNQGVLIEQNPEVIAGVLRSLFILTLHQKEIGQLVYKKTMELHIDLIVEGLVTEEN